VFLALDLQLSSVNDSYTPFRQVPGLKRYQHYSSQYYATLELYTIYAAQQLALVSQQRSSLLLQESARASNASSCLRDDHGRTRVLIGL
jgi:hypothetical protein